MKFNLTETTEEIWSCQDCIWSSTKRHFVSDDGMPSCTLCGGSAAKIGTIEQSSGMSEFEYRRVLASLEEHCSGVGSGVTSAIGDTFENGDDFIEACRNAYDEQDYSGLTEVSGVGEGTAQKICLSIADSRDWEGGLAESSFSFA